MGRCTSCKREATILTRFNDKLLQWLNKVHLSIYCTRMRSDKTVRERLPLSHRFQKRAPCKALLENRTGEFLVREKQKLPTALKAACRLGSAVSSVCLSSLTGVQKQN